MEAQHSANGSGAAPAQRSSLGSSKPPAKKLTIPLKKGLVLAPVCTAFALDAHTASPRKRWMLEQCGGLPHVAGYLPSV